MTERVGLLGWPVAHSVSPAMHGAAFAACGLDWQYDLLPAAPDRFSITVSECVARGYRGFNVTVPHKAAALRLPEIVEASAAAQAIGAVNTLVVRSGGFLIADNTDWRGFLDDLAVYGVSTAGDRCLILGSGGSAQAVGYALRHGGAATVTVISRTPDGRAGVMGYDALEHLAPEVDLVVNCTPVGMHPHVGHSPWPDDVAFPADAILYDLVYNPPRTRLVAQAEAAGARAISGLGMLVRQGALAFEQWTGHTPPVEVMTAAARAALGME